GIDDRGAQVRERAGERLLDLGGDRGRGVVGQAVVLARPESEFRLQEQLVAGQPAGDRRRDRPADGGLVVVAALVGGVDAAEALAQGQLGQALRLVLFPGRPVQEARHAHAVNRQGRFGHRLLPPVSTWAAYGTTGWKG